MSSAFKSSIWFGWYSFVKYLICCNKVFGHILKILNILLVELSRINSWEQEYVNWLGRTCINPSAKSLTYLFVTCYLFSLISNYFFPISSLLDLCWNCWTNINCFSIKYFLKLIMISRYHISPLCALSYLFNKWNHSLTHVQD